MCQEFVILLSPKPTVAINYVDPSHHSSICSKTYTYSPLFTMKTASLISPIATSLLPVLVTRRAGGVPPVTGCRCKTDYSGFAHAVQTDWLWTYCTRIRMSELWSQTTWLHVRLLPCAHPSRPRDEQHTHLCPYSSSNNAGIGVPNLVKDGTGRLVGAVTVTVRPPPCNAELRPECEAL